MLDAGGPDLRALLDTLLPNNEAAVQELLGDVAAGRTWQRVLPVPPPLICSLVGALGTRQPLNPYFQSAYRSSLAL